MLQQFIESSGGVIPATVILMLALNAALTGLKSALEFIKDKTATDADNKAFLVVSKLCGILSGIIDWATANKAH